MNHREAAKRTWSTRGDLATKEEIKIGALLRIADSTEKMCTDRDRLERERAMYKQWWQEEQVKNTDLRRTIAGLKGYITRLKKDRPK